MSWLFFNTFNICCFVVKSTSLRTFMLWVCSKWISVAQSGTRRELYIYIYTHTHLHIYTRTHRTKKRKEKKKFEEKKHNNNFVFVQWPIFSHFESFLFFVVFFVLFVSFYPVLYLRTYSENFKYELTSNFEMMSDDRIAQTSRKKNEISQTSPVVRLESPIYFFGIISHIHINIYTYQYYAIQMDKTFSVLLESLYVAFNLSTNQYTKRCIVSMPKPKEVGEKHTEERKEKHTLFNQSFLGIHVQTFFNYFIFMKFISMRLDERRKHIDSFFESWTITME